MKRTGIDRRKELKNKALNDVANMKYAVHMRADNMKDYADFTSENTGKAINKAYRKSESVITDIKDGSYKIKRGFQNASQSISNHIRKTEEKHTMEVKKL